MPPAYGFINLDAASLYFLLIIYTLLTLTVIWLTKNWLLII